MRFRLSGWGLACMLISLAFSSGPAHAAAGLEVAFAGPCALSAPITYPTVPTTGTRTFDCWAGSTVPASMSGVPTYFEVVQHDSLTKAYTVPNDTENGAAFWGGVSSRNRGLCSGGITLSGTRSRGLLGGPWCLHNTGTFTATIPPLTTFISGSWILFGDTLVIIGTANHGLQSGPFAALAHIEPNVLIGESCVYGATNFLIAGVGAGLKFGPGLPFD